MAAVVPVVPTSPAVAIQNEDPTLSIAKRVPRELTYELRASAEQLPTINCAKSVKDVWLSPAGLTRCNTFLRRHKTALALSTTVGTLSGAIALFAPARVGGLFGIAACVLNFPGSIVGLLVLRYDMVRIILRTYDFWYLSAMNVVAMVLTMVLFSDERSLSLLPAMVGFEITILIDANYRAVNATMRTSVISGAILCSFMVVSLLGLIYDATNPPVFSYGTRSVSVVDGIVNCLSTVVLMLWRNAFRKHLVLDGSSAAVRCVTYRCRMRLCITPPSQPIVISTSTNTTSVVRKVLVRQSSSRARLLAPMAQLQFVESSDLFHPTRTLFQRVYEPGLGPLHPMMRWALHATAIVGITTTTLVFFLPGTNDGGKTLPIVSAAATLLFCTVYAAHAQRDLLRRLVLSFDFAFLSLQLSVAHLCVCDALRWDVRCLGVLSSWLWVHWVLAIDAVTPVMRARLGYTRHLARLVLALFVAAHVALSLELVVWNRLALQDRAVASATVGRHRVQVRTIPVLFGRMVTTLLWSCRLLTRLLRRSPGELIMIQGSVMYHDYQRERRRTATASGVGIVNRPAQSQDK